MAEGPAGTTSTRRLPIMEDEGEDLFLEGRLSNPIRQSVGKQGTDPEEVDEFVKHVEEKNRYQPEFLQAFHEVFQSVKPALLMNPDYLRAFKVIVEPERSITFRVPWVDDNGK
ncbi:glutamate dehydrogenase, partial [Cystoisospora suis]